MLTWCAVESASTPPPGQEVAVEVNGVSAVSGTPTAESPVLRKSNTFFASTASITNGPPWYLIVVQSGLLVWLRLAIALYAGKALLRPYIGTVTSGKMPLTGQL